MGNEVINMYEREFIIDDYTFKEIQSKLLYHMELEQFNKINEFYTISNIYYDTVDNIFIRNAQSNPGYKELIRIRSHGVTYPDSKVYLEIKKKLYDVVNLRRTTIKLNEAYNFVSKKMKPEFKSYMDNQVINEVEYILSLYNLEPKIYLAYDRKAFFSKENHGLKVTFDTNVRARRENLKLEDYESGHVLLDSGQWFMKIKVKNSVPLWLSKLLSEFKVFRSNSHNIKISLEWDHTIKNYINKVDNFICFSK